jgi:hypothetical protein
LYIQFVLCVKLPGGNRNCALLAQSAARAAKNGKAGAVARHRKM